MAAQAIRLTDFVLLDCSFRAFPWEGDPERQPAEIPPDSEAYADEDVLALSGATRIHEDAVTLFLEARLDDVTLPFTLDLTVGARFDVPHAAVAQTDLQPTLIRIVYPYLRELVSAVTNRSPLPPYFLPALVAPPVVAPLDVESPADEPAT